MSTPRREKEPQNSLRLELDVPTLSPYLGRRTGLRWAWHMLQLESHSKQACLGLACLLRVLRPTHAVETQWQSRQTIVAKPAMAREQMPYLGLMCPWPARVRKQKLYLGLMCRCRALRQAPKAQAPCAEPAMANSPSRGSRLSNGSAFGSREFFAGSESRPPQQSLSLQLVPQHPRLLLEHARKIFRSLESRQTLYISALAQKYPSALPAVYRRAQSLPGDCRRRPFQRRLAARAWLHAAQKLGARPKAHHPPCRENLRLQAQKQQQPPPSGLSALLLGLALLLPQPTAASSLKVQALTLSLAVVPGISALAPSSRMPRRCSGCRRVQSALGQGWHPKVWAGVHLAAAPRAWPQIEAWRTPRCSRCRWLLLLIEQRTS